VCAAERRIGLMVPSIFVQQPLKGDELRAFVRTADEAGVASLMVGDHLNWYCGTFECLTLASFVGAMTRARVGTNVLVLPLRQPFVVAKMAATLAHLTDGRFALGVGVGGEHPAEFEALGIPPERRGARTDEGLALIRRLLKGEHVDVEGQFVSARGAHLDPNPGFALLLGGRSEAALRRVARYGDGWSSAWVRPDQFRQARAQITELTREAGRDPERFEWVAHARVVLGRTQDEAWDDASAYLARYYNADPGPFRGHTIAGPPESAIEKIGAYFEAGADEVLVTFAARDVVGQQQRFVNDVLPHLGLR
jgi:alkanesulfonate monooxygenase SsuD/methylene tetrahydromethanopterin reductase-like flavin-dependent oxidoreductase (luciferase family)